MKDVYGGFFDFNFENPEDEFNYNLEDINGIDFPVLQYVPHIEGFINLEEIDFSLLNDGKKGIHAWEPWTAFQYRQMITLFHSLAPKYPTDFKCLVLTIAKEMQLDVGQVQTYVVLHRLSLESLCKLRGAGANLGLNVENSTNNCVARGSGLNLEKRPNNRVDEGSGFNVGNSLNNRVAKGSGRNVENRLNNRVAKGSGLNLENRPNNRVAKGSGFNLENSPNNRVDEGSGLNVENRSNNRVAESSGLNLENRMGSGVNRPAEVVSCIENMMNDIREGAGLDFEAMKNRLAERVRYLVNRLDRGVVGEGEGSRVNHENKLKSVGEGEAVAGVDEGGVGIPAVVDMRWVPWSIVETAKLKAAVLRHTVLNKVNWNEVAVEMEPRTKDQCQGRYKYFCI